MSNHAVGIGVLVIGAVACGGVASPAGEDAATPDAGVDAATDAPAAWTSTPPCPDTVDAIYEAQAPGPRGSIARCALGDELDQAAVQAELDDGGAEGVVAQTGVRIVKLAYRTVRSTGGEAISTATVYLPLVPRALPAPLVLIGRPTSGIADTCAPSRDARPERSLALPFAARGFVTVSPDFAGLGNAGVHAYLDNHEAVRQLFDGAAAVRALVPGGVVGDPIGAVGYSQGGGVVLSAQALEHATTGARTLRGVVAIAPEWPTSTRSFGYEDVLRNPDGLTALAGLASPTVAVLRHYGFLANRMGDAHAADAFPAAERASLVGAIESLCTIPLGGALNGQQPRLRDLVDPGFRDQVLACIDGTAGCDGPGAAFHQWLIGDFVTADPAGARVLIVQGLLDQVMLAAGQAACDVAKLNAEGVAPDVCADALGTHDTVLERKIEHAVAWIEAVVDGTSAPSCGGASLPACDR